MKRETVVLECPSCGAQQTRAAVDIVPRQVFDVRCRCGECWTVEATVLRRKPGFTIRKLEWTFTGRA